MPQPHQIVGRGSAAARTWYGCQIGSPGGDFWDEDVTNAPLDPESAEMIASVDAAAQNMGIPDIDMGFSDDQRNARGYSGGLYPINLAAAGTPTVPVQARVAWHLHPPSPVPWTSSFNFEYPGSDEHYFVVDATMAPECHDYEYYWADIHAGHGGAYIRAYAGMEINLRTTQLIAKDGGPTVTGINYLPSAITADELAAAGAPIRHVLNFVAPSKTINLALHGLMCKCHRYPALNDGVPYGGPAGIPQSEQLPEGAQLRLHFFYPENGTEPCNRVLEAMKHYGMVFRDTGSAYPSSNIVNTVDYPNQMANDDANLSCLIALRYDDFDVVAAHK